MNQQQLIYCACSQFRAREARYSKQTHDNGVSKDELVFMKYGKQKKKTMRKHIQNCI